jgi:sterol desaturase/sphingolipid hydroxylase (fatty acid hydroxylase superfamily)
MLWVDYALIFVVLAPILALAERLAPESPSVDARASVRWRRADWLFAALQLALVPATWVCLLHLAPLVTRSGLFVRGLMYLPSLVSAAAAFVLADVAAYWLHRLEHCFAATWRLHSVHHSPTRLDWLSGRRFHPLDASAQVVLPSLLVAGLGFPLASLDAYVFVAGLVTTLAHCDLASPGSVVDRLVVTPAYHRSHHERGREGRNFAVVLPVLDRLFGTADVRFTPLGGSGRRFGLSDRGGDDFLDLLLLRKAHPESQPASTTKPAQNETALAT